MVLGMNPMWVPGFILGAGIMPLALFHQYELLNSATAILLMAGINAGLQAQVVGAVYLGGLI